MILTRKSRQVIPQDRLIKTFAALGDGTRMKIVRELLKGNDVCVGQLAEKLGVSTSAISQACRILELTGLIRRDRMGQKICYRLNRNEEFVSQLTNLVLKTN